MPGSIRRLSLALSIAVIAFATLTPAGGEGTADFCILCGDRGVSDMLSNVLLFIPLGFAFRLNGWSFRRAVIAGIAYTFAIETAQLSLVTGRDANIGDVLANSLGTMCGWFIAGRRRWWLAGENDAVRAPAVAAAVALLLTAALLLFTPSLPRSTYYMQWSADLRGMDVYAGRVSSSQIGGLNVAGGGPVPDSRQLRDSLTRAVVTIEASHVQPRGLAPIVSIYDEQQRQIMLIGARGSDLVYRYRMKADRLQLDRGDLRMAEVFASVPEGAAYTLAVESDRRRFCAALNGTRRCRAAFTTGDTWTLLLSLDTTPWVIRVVSGMWLLCVFVPAGLLARSGRAIIAAMGVTAGILVPAPWMAGFAATPAWQVAAALVGILVGAAGGWSLRTAMKSPAEADAGAVLTT